MLVEYTSVKTHQQQRGLMWFYGEFMVGECELDCIFTTGLLYYNTVKNFLGRGSERHSSNTFDTFANLANLFHILQTFKILLQTLQTFFPHLANLQYTFAKILEY